MQATLRNKIVRDILGGPGEFGETWVNSLVKHTDAFSKQPTFFNGQGCDDSGKVKETLYSAQGKTEEKNFGKQKIGGRGVGEGEGARRATSQTSIPLFTPFWP